MQIINATPHSITLIDHQDQQKVIRRSFPAARLRFETGPMVDEVDGIAIHRPPKFCDIENLPPKQDGTIVVVSQLTAIAVAALYPDRDDVVYPATSYHDGAERDEHGVIGVRRLFRAI